MEPRPRVIVAFPDAVECQLLSELLSEGHEPIPAREVAAAVHHVQTRQPHLVVADAAFAFDDAMLTMCRGRGAPTPLVVIGDPNRAAETAAERHGAFYVRRPVDADVLLCTVAMALIDNRPTRRSQRKAVARFEAMAEGFRCALIDVSNEGLRLAIPRGGRSAPPPFFSLRVPKVGVTLVVQRIWLAAPAHQSDALCTWCGGALAENGAREEQKWRSFVDLVPRSA
jgi:hypothetical protein